ncbi:hypothetical protein [uncultured Murdochiella sp.]|uniref:hypothetical protein n=1 Tax=uncultured Murdochiella sp. TaxID=1586095 RepID=UPI0028057AD4|nr:hypothetical protein [uncultured Murdochiella sp.]
MGKRFRFEFMRSIPFFVTLVLGGTAYWLVLRQMLMHPETLFTVTFLLPLFIGLSFVVASVVYVIVNVNRELSNPSGLLTFLTPLAPWKLMVAKWLNFMVSFGLSFLIMRFLVVLFPLEAVGVPIGVESMASLAEAHHPINVPFLFLMNMSALSCLVFVLRWTLVLALVFWALGWTQVLASRSVLRHGKFALRALSFLGTLFVVDEVGAYLTTFLPWYIDVDRFQLLKRSVPMPFHFTLESSTMLNARTAIAGQMYRTGVPVILLVFLLLVILFFFWRAQAYWKKIDR